MMTPKEFTDIQHKLGLSAQGLADKLDLSPSSQRTIRRYRSGESEIPGPIAIAMRCFRDHGVSPDPEPVSKAPPPKQRTYMGKTYNVE